MSFPAFVLLLFVSGNWREYQACRAHELAGANAYNTNLVGD